MFDIHCAACDRRRLVFAGQVLGIENGSHGITVTYRCWCGATGVMRTGRLAEAPAPLAAAS
ncbi:MAG TPA: hypothetical protein VNU26_14435 [Mycobacteriales bacterium]|nr:hypothetical protein [Mycobacteriales bacterium]